MAQADPPGLVDDIGLGHAVDPEIDPDATIAVGADPTDVAVTPDGTPRTLLGRFTFADVAMAQVLAFVEPPLFGLRIGRASRRSFTDPGMRERYADLLAWRDAVYGAHRPRR